MKFSRFFPALLVFALVSPLFADPEVPEIAKAKSLVAAGSCAEVQKLLEPVVKKSFKKPEGEKAAVLLAECALRSGSREVAGDYSSRFLEYYVESPYRERMEILSAILKIEDGDVYDGVEALLKVVAQTENPAAKARAREVAEQTLAASLMGAEELQALLEKYPVDNDIDGWLELQIGRESQNARRYKAARYWYNRTLKREGVSNRLHETAQSGLASLEGQGAGKPAILVLAPLSGEFAEFGVAVMHGAMLALEKAGLSNKVHLRVADTKADAFTALRQTQRAINQDSVIAVIGPVMSAPAATVAAWLGSNFAKIPMITPTATDDGIAAMGPNIFQLNLTMSQLAKSIANYAVDCFGVHEFAILSPLGDYGNAMTSSFSQAVEARGGKVVALQNYMEGRTDYKTEFDLLRSVRYKQLARRQNIARGASNLDEFSAKERKSFLQDSVAKFEAIFVPSTNPADGGLMAGQIAFYKVSGLLLGTSGWYGRDLLINGKNQVNGAYLSVPASELSDGADYSSFADAYKEKWGEDPDEGKIAALGYDAVNVVVAALGKGEANLAKVIREGGSFKGALGEIKFEGGANVNAKIVTVEKNRFVTLDGCPEKQEKQGKK